MKPNKTIHQRPWCPMGFITHSGLLLSPSHVAHVCPYEEQEAARITTKIINRMMKP